MLSLLRLKDPLKNKLTWRLVCANLSLESSYYLLTIYGIYDIDWKEIKIMKELIPWEQLLY